MVHTPEGGRLNPIPAFPARTTLPLVFFPPCSSTSLWPFFFSLKPADHSALYAGFSRASRRFSVRSLFSTLLEDFGLDDRIRTSERSLITRFEAGKDPPPSAPQHPHRHLKSQIGLGRSRSRLVFRNNVLPRPACSLIWLGKKHGGGQRLFFVCIRTASC